MANGETKPAPRRTVVANRIDLICDEFEMRIATGQEARIEEFLAGADEVVHPRLFKELILVELEYRRKRGEQPSWDDYCHRFDERLYEKLVYIALKPLFSR